MTLDYFKIKINLSLPKLPARIGHVGMHCSPASRPRLRVPPRARQQTGRSRATLEM